MDFAYNSQQNVTVKSLAPKGATSPKSVKKAPKYTNCYVVANKPDGSSLPTLMFTYDPKLNIKNKEYAPELKVWLKKLKIDEWRVIFLDQKSKEKSSTYCRESREITSTAIQSWARQLNSYKNCTFLTDNGYAFKEGSESIILKRKAKKHIFMPSEAHAHISTCDNGVNFPAKTRWRKAAIRGDISLDVEPQSSLYLLSMFDSIPAKEIKRYWERNFQINNDNPTIEDIDKAVQNSRYRFLELHGQCREMFQDFMTNTYIESTVSTREKRVRDTGLDGRHWTPKKKRPSSPDVE